MRICLINVDKAEVLRRLYNYAVPVSSSISNYVPGDMNIELAKQLIDGTTKSPDYVGDDHVPGEFDYLYGRYMKIDLSGDYFHTDAYDAQYGKDIAYKLLKDMLPQ